MRVAWIRFLRAVRWRTRWSRKRARSRSARTVGSGSSDRRHEVAPGELGEDPGVDLVGLGRQGCEALHLHRVGDLDVPAVELELVVDEAGPVHRLDDRAHRLAVAGNPGDELAEPEDLGRCRGHLDRPAFLVEDVHIKPLARQVESGVQHAWASR
jgi:hypothetical protein